MATQVATDALERRTFRINDFAFASGARLDELVVEYATLGEPRRDRAGKICNAVLYAHGWSGDYRQGTSLAKDLFQPGAPFDPARWYLVFPTALGSPGSSAPSTSGLGADFPAYGIVDMVTAQHALVTEHLGIGQLAGVAGASMGGYQTLEWITRFPRTMRWAVPMATAAATTGRNVGVWSLMSRTIASDPAYAQGRYAIQPEDALERALMGTYLWFYAPAWYERFATVDATLEGLRAAAASCKTVDANDVIWRNRAMLSHDVRGRLSEVRAKVLVVGVTSDELFPPAEEVEPLAAAIPGAKLVIYPSLFGHDGSDIDVAKANPTIQAFLDEQAA